MFDVYQVCVSLWFFLCVCTRVCARGHWDVIHDIFAPMTVSIKLFFSLSLLLCIVSPLSCVSCVPVSCVHIWFVSCPCLMWLLVKSVPAMFVSLACVFDFLPVQFRVIWSTRYSPVFLFVSAMPCPAQPCLSTLKTIIWVYSSSASSCILLVCAPWHV